MSSGVNLSFECGGGSSSVSNPSSENQALFGNPNARFGEPCLVMNKEEEDVVMQDTIELKANKKLPKENFKSKNLHSERKRRDRINQRIYALRSVVPRITKVLLENSFLFLDHSSLSSVAICFLIGFFFIHLFMKMNKNGTLSDAVDYIKELLVEKKKLEDELNGINEMECTETAAKEESTVANPEAEKIVAKLNKKVNNEVSNIELKIISICEHVKQSHKLLLFLFCFFQVNLEVHEIGERDFLIKVAQEHKRDGFKRLIEAVDSCGLEIVDVNFTRLNLTVVTLLNVKVT